VTSLTTPQWNMLTREGSIHLIPRLWATIGPHEPGLPQPGTAGRVFTGHVECYGSVQLDNGAIRMCQTRLALGGAKAWRKGRRSRRHAVALGNMRPVNLAVDAPLRWMLGLPAQRTITVCDTTLFSSSLCGCRVEAAILGGFVDPSSQ